MSVRQKLGLGMPFFPEQLEYIANITFFKVQKGYGSIISLKILEDIPKTKPKVYAGYYFPDSEKDCKIASNLLFKFFIGF